MFVIHGLYYLVAKLSDGRALIRDEHDEPISELFERGPLPPEARAESKI